MRNIKFLSMAVFIAMIMVFSSRIASAGCADQKTEKDCLKTTYHSVLFGTETCTWCGPKAKGYYCIGAKGCPGTASKKVK